MSHKFAILGLLNIAPMTGYIIKKNLELSIKKFWPVSYGGLYPALHKLDEEGLIRSESMVNDGRSSIKYFITDQGKKALDAWLIKNNHQVQCKDEYILKIFLSQDLTKVQKTTLLEDYLRFKEDQYRSIQNLLDVKDSKRYYSDDHTHFVILFTYHTLEKEIELIKDFINKQ